jgi:hypothetical protein
MKSTAHQAQTQIKKPAVYACELILFEEKNNKRRHSGNNASLALPLKYVLILGRVVGILPMHTSNNDNANS